MRMILAGGLTPENVADAVQTVDALGRRRVDRRRGVAGQEGRPQGQALHRAGPRRRAGARTSPTTSCPTTGPTSEHRGTERRVTRSLMGEPTGLGRFGEFGGRFVPETLVPACEELEAAFREAWADRDVPRRARRHPPRLRRAAVVALRVPQPRPAARAAPAAQARGPQPHRVAQDQQRARPGAARQADGQAAVHRRDRRRPARRGHGHGGGADGPRVQGVHGRGRRRTARSSTSSACACSAPRSRRSRAAAARSRTPSTRRCATGSPTSSRRYYCLGSVMGPHPYPWMVREFHRVIGDEAREQCQAADRRRSRRRRRVRRRRLQRHRAVLRLRRHRRPGSSASNRPAAPPSATASPASSTACAAT